MKRKQFLYVVSTEEGENHYSETLKDAHNDLSHAVNCLRQIGANGQKAELFRIPWIAGVVENGFADEYIGGDHFRACLDTPLCKLLDTREA